MPRVTIVDKAGKPTKYFWSDKGAPDRKHLRVFKRAPDGKTVLMTGVYFDADANKFHKE